MLVGSLDVGGDLVITAAVTQAPVAVVGPLGSLAPVFAVLIATVILREHLRRRQAVGVVIVLVGIVLIATA